MTENSPKWNLKKLFNTEELVMDITIALFIPVIYHYLMPQGPRTLLLLTPATALVFAGMVSFVISIYLGHLYNRLGDHGCNNGLVRFIFFLAVTGVFMGPIIMLAANKLIPSSWVKQGYSMFNYMVPAGASLAGLMIGFRPEYKEEVKFCFYVPGTVFVAVFPFTLINLFSAGQADTAFLTILITAFIFIVPLVLKKKLSNVFSRQVFQKKALRLSATILVTLLFAAALILWQESTLLGMVKAAINNKTTLSNSGVFWSLVAGGIIPIRLLASFTPPVRWANLGVTAVVFYFYIDSVFALAAVLNQAVSG